MKAFLYEAQPSRVIFGIGSLKEVSTEIKALGSKKALVIATPEQESLAQEVARITRKFMCGSSCKSYPTCSNGKCRKIS